MTAPATYNTTTESRTAPTDRIAGFTSAGMIDWPGRVAATVFLSGCAYRCPYCHNPQLTRAASDGSQWNALQAYLRLRRSWIDGVVLTGGEPTDDPGLIPLLEALAEEPIPVKLDTNGSHPELLGRLIADKLVGYVAVDFKTTPLRYEAVTGRVDAADRILRTVEVVKSSGVPHEFRTTVYPGAVDIDELPLIAEILGGCDLYALQQFRNSATLDPRALRVEPYHPDHLQTALAACQAHVPTTLRGA